MSPFRCSQCGQIVFFENTHCEQCGAVLGFVPGLRKMMSFAPPADPAPTSEGQPDAPILPWTCLCRAPDAQAEATPLRLRPCANRVVHGVCNWMLDEGDEAALCLSCRLTEVIPSLDKPVNLNHWALIERAKRRLVMSLMDIGLTPRPKTGPEDKRGLAFHLLEPLPDGPPVMTGHDDGLITLNIAEADDVYREQARVSMHEPVRTLLGHVRHEVSHYLQQRYIDGTPEAEECRAVFGDERQDYAEALKRQYENGPPIDWPEHFVSAYASSHPWEDWAETCAHYLLVIDAVQTAAGWGLQLSGPAAATEAPDGDAKALPVDDLVLNHWLPVAQFLNAMNRSLGMPDSYPFLMPPAVLHKMATVQRLLRVAAERSAAEPEVADPQMAEPAAADPETADPQMAEPAAAHPEAAAPEPAPMPAAMPAAEIQADLPSGNETTPA